MAANPLIAAKEDTTDWSTGISLVSSVTDLSDAISGGSWIEVGLGVVGLGAEAVSLVVDPLGTLAGYGVGWLIEHCQPLQDALDWIAGDPAQIEAYAKTWDNVATRISEVATAQNAAVTADVSDWTGQTATAYKSAASNTTNLLTAANTAATAAASAIRMAGGIVAAVRETVRDLVAQTVGRLAVWAAELVFSVGLATPLVAVQATAYIAKTVATISKLFSKLAKTMSKLKPLLKQLKSAFGDIAKAFKKTPSKSSKNADNTTTSPASTKPADTPTTPSTTKQPDTPTNPASTPDTPAKSTSPGDTAPASTPDLNAKKPESPSTTNEGAPEKARIGDPATTQDAKGTCGGREPVDFATGEYFVPVVDVTLPGVLPVVLWRRHRSNYRFGRWFGPSWSSALDLRIVVDHAGVTFVAEDGILLSYPHDVPDLAVLPLHGDSPWPLTRTSTDTFRVHDPDREITWHFAAPDAESAALGDFPITAITDRHDNWIRFHYDLDRAPTRITSSGGYQLSFATGSGRVTAITVDDARSGTGESTAIRQFAYQSGDLVAVTNGVGATTHYTYDNSHRMLSWRDSNNTWFTNTYDNQGRVVAQDGIDGIWSSRFAYETLPHGQGAITTVTDSLGVASTYQFDAQMRLHIETDGLGYATRTDYLAGRKPVRSVGPDLATTTYVYDMNDDLTMVRRPDGRTITFEYHSLHRPSVITAADGGVTRYTYDDAGNATSVTDADGISRQYTYHPNGGIHTFSDSPDATTAVDVDAAGLPVRAIDPVGGILTVARDHFGRPTTTTNPLGQAVHHDWSDEGKPVRRTGADDLVETWNWDGEGNLVARTDRSGRIDTYVYGPFSLCESFTSTGTDTTRYTWDTERRLTSVSNPNGQTWHYVYGPTGQIYSETDYNDATTTYAYNPSGAVAVVTTPTGIRRYNSYDQLGQLVGTRAESGEWVSYSYDLVGRITTAANGLNSESARTVTHSLLSRHSPAGRLLSQQIDSQIPTEYRYDNYGRRVSHTSPMGVSTEFEYGRSNKVVALRTCGRRVDFTHDAVGRQNSWRSEGVGQHSTFGLAGLTVSRELVQLDPRTSIPSELIHRDEYLWRPDGYLSAHSVIDRAGVERRDFTLDPLGRVARITAAGAIAEEYRYDSLSNLIFESGAMAGRRGMDSDETDAPQFEYSRNLLARAGRTRYHYDAAGRLLRKEKTRISRKAAVWHYEYNAFDQLISVRTPDGQQWQYTYDPFGRRRSKMLVNGRSRSEFNWDGTHLTEQASVNEDGSRTTTAWSYHPGTYIPLTQSADNHEIDREFHAIVTGLDGSPTHLVDPDRGEVVAHSASTLWGATTWVGIDTPHRFQGQQFDSESGLHYNHHRYYDPETGRYLTQDPLGLNPAPNPNTYPHNPMSWIDPLGLACGDSNSEELPTRHAALRQAMRDAGIPTSQQPSAVERVRMEDMWGHAVLDENYQEIMTEEYHFTAGNGNRIVIQDHSAGHRYGEDGVGDQGPHFNVRPIENTRTGKVPGTLGHYPFQT
ncbi:HNH/endonuclease VII fold putative polymorphic toxin [Nocardia sp. NPDC059195]|uniref:HNH/endonuclease VII fold putative polymorphic toxin n=1 Tax=Nocardia sp. NPDC059195 TaxID=3346765 RepID=UPI00369CA818